MKNGNNKGMGTIDIDLVSGGFGFVCIYKMYPCRNVIYFILFDIIKRDLDCSKRIGVMDIGGWYLVFCGVMHVCT